MSALTVLPVTGLPEVGVGDDLAALIAAACELRDGDVVVVAQKVVSKAEGAVVAVPPGEDRAAARARIGREQAVRVLAESPWTTIVETRHGLVCAAAGVDASNVRPGELTLLPDDPDASARRLRAGLQARTGADVAVVVSDTFGRPWRLGQTDVAIGLAGMAAIRDERGGTDRFGSRLEVTEVAVADEVAAAADLVRGKAEGVPVVVLRGLAWQHDDEAAAADLRRPPASDLFPRGRGAVADALAQPEAPGPAGRPDADDWRRALAAARAAGGDSVSVVRTSASSARIEGTDRFALGAATATLRAALADLGWGMTVADAAGSRVLVDVTAR